MAKTLQQILGHVFLAGIVENIKTGIPDVLPPEFFSVTKDVLGDEARYTRYGGTRQTLQRVEYGAPPKRLPLQDIGSFPVKLLHVYNEKQLDITAYQSLRAYDNYQVQERGIQEIERQMVQFVRRDDNTRLAAVYSMLAKGAIYWDENGNLLPTSSGASLTVDYGIPANNQNQLNGVIAASWATTSTDIPAHLRALKQRAVQDHGFDLKYAFYGINIPGYLYKNDFCKEFMWRGQRTNDAFLHGGPEIPDGFEGFTWIPVYKSFFADQNNTVQEFFGDDQVTFTPAIAGDVYDYMRGSYPVPNSFSVTDSFQGASDNFTIKYGRFAYATPSFKPPTADLNLGNTFLPVWKVPDTMYIADVVP